MSPHKSLTSSAQIPICREHQDQSHSEYTQPRSPVGTWTLGNWAEGYVRAPDLSRVQSDIKIENPEVILQRVLASCALPTVVNLPASPSDSASGMLLCLYTRRPSDMSKLVPSLFHCSFTQLLIKNKIIQHKKRASLIDNPVSVSGGSFFHQCQRFCLKAKA